ncbi:unnamed protein product [Chondrus crispus]|uniref:Uncharacterized protein n=1 Tax=Chondrus crispus TaxID=2769 RepID=R7QNJ3_CHOCR|nr:unnamed protein product [Chondrus crispus]CDF38950.1 unnamed protein product [Chondrus crispus]|eukprot:XP_005718855.1 unnamed protein product [Chondrus crispus]
MACHIPEWRVLWTIDHRPCIVQCCTVHRTVKCGLLIFS